MEYEGTGNWVNEEDKEVEDDEEFDISDSEFKEYKEAVHKLLKFRNYNVRAPSGQFRCPFCAGEEKQGYHCLLEHAVRVAECSTGSGKQRANHSAMAKYLVIDLSNEEKTMPTRKILERKDETHCKAFREARYFLGIAKDQSKSVLEELEILDSELNPWKEELDKGEVDLTEEKRKDNLTEERLINDELLEVGEELMKGLENMPSHWPVKFRVMDWRETDEKAFMNVIKECYQLSEAEIKSFEYCCFLVKQWRDAKWNPQIMLEGLKDQLGKKIYNAAVAVLEYNDYRNNIELWNIEEQKKASYCEVIRYIFRKWKTLQCERDELVKTIHSMPLSRPRAMSYIEEDESDLESWLSEDCPAPKADKWNVKKDIKAKKDLIKPLKPAYLLFMEDFHKAYKKKHPNNKSIDDFAKAGGEKWRSMSEAEKAPYLAKFAKQKQEYEKFMIAQNKKLKSYGDEESERSAYDKLEDDDSDAYSYESY